MCNTVAKRHGAAACFTAKCVAHCSGVAVKFGAPSKRDQGASDQRDYASDLVICTLA